MLWMALFEFRETNTPPEYNQNITLSPKYLSASLLFMERIFFLFNISPFCKGLKDCGSHFWENEILSLTLCWLMLTCIIYPVMQYFMNLEMTFIKRYI